ncbi:MAG: hypothetical protein HeimC3_34570 [Candidatus Heimdallarchaeota archaeon LC_3]|nr:MAG: hypothetical protein HeimC3_34570 [Candidatus Heimdallarchaeota archaeon LC_3]
MNPPGNETKSMKTIQNYSKEYSIKGDIYESTENRGNLLAKIEGVDPLVPALILGPAHVV